MNGNGAAVDEGPMTFEDSRKAFYYGRYSDMQFKFLARMGDEPATARSCQARERRTRLATAPRSSPKTR
jgi:hypothetical protein